MNKSTPKLFANCIPVKGKNRSLIFDIQRNNYVEIPNDLYEILVNHKGKTIEKINTFYKNQYNDIINDYFQILFENEFVFFTKKPYLFPELDFEWFEPFELTHAIIDFGSYSHELEVILKQLSNLNCKFLEIRFYHDVDLEYLYYIDSVLEKIKSNTIGVEFVIKKNKKYKLEEYDFFLQNNKRIYSITLNSSEDNFIQKFQNNKRIIGTRINIESEKSCGIIKDDLFSINTKTFSESMHYNSCLNRKISIDQDGNIKNCPSMPQSFGNIKDTTLEEALNHPDFKKYWNIKKDDIEVCKDCEFRYVCTDCRAYIEEPENMYSKPLKCGYNPYTNQWEEWSTNPLKQKAIEYYGLQDLVKKDA